MDPVLGAMTGVTLGLVVIALLALARLSATVSRTERKMNILLKQSGIDITAESADAVVNLVRQGKKIEAIKLYREMTGSGLAEAKEHVESLV